MRRWNCLEEDRNGVFLIPLGFGLEGYGVLGL